MGHNSIQNTVLWNSSKLLLRTFNEEMKDLENSKLQLKKIKEEWKKWERIVSWIRDSVLMILPKAIHRFNAFPIKTPCREFSPNDTSNENNNN